MHSINIHSCTFSTTNVVEVFLLLRCAIQHIGRVAHKHNCSSARWLRDCNLYFHKFWYNLLHSGIIMCNYTLLGRLLVSQSL